MFRLGSIIGLVVGALLGYLASYDIDTSLGAIKVPVYIGIGAFGGWMSGLIFYMSPPGSQAVASRDAELTAATKRAVAAEAEVQRLRERVAELERRG